MEFSNGARAAVATVALTVASAGCVSPERVMPESAGQCGINGTDEAVMRFDGTHFFQERDFGFASDITDSIDEMSPDNTPEEFANALISSLSGELGTLKVVIDPSVNLGEWHTGEGGEDQQMRRGQKISFLYDLADVMSVLSEYPPGLLSVLGVDTVKLADTYKSDAIGGHYDTSANEIQIEYNKARESGFDIRRLKITVAHEIGHAIHDTLCAGYDHDDLELAGSIEFLGYPPGKATEDELTLFYQQVPIAQVVYGPERIFPGLYGATSVEEYFASIVSFTTEERGLIQEGDADYGTLLYKNQQLVVDRIEQLLPGFRAFVEQQTRILRRDPDNEINKYVQETFITTREVRELALTAKGQTVVLNGLGVVANPGGSSVNVVLHPAVEISDSGELHLQLDSDNYLNLSLTDVKNDLYFFRPSGSEELFANESDVIQQSLTIDELPRRQQLWVGDPATDRVLTAAEEQGLELVHLMFVS